MLPKGKTLHALIRFVESTGLDTVLVTGGAETTGHTSHSFHYKGLAVDIAGPKFNNLDDAMVQKLAQAAGFTHGEYEFDKQDPNWDHWHLQIGAGNRIGNG